MKMASSDDEGEPVAQLVTNYYFVDEKEEPIPFSVLPIQWSGVKNPDSIKRQVFLHGIADDGLQKIYKQVKAWKFELSDEQPKISVLSKENNWITLQKPRKSFDEIVRTTLITVQWLAILKKNVEIGGKSLWDQLQKVFSSYVVRPTENDLLDHLIREAVKHDETLLKSKLLLAFLENSKKRKAPIEHVHGAQDMKKFIVDDDDNDGIGGDTDVDESMSEEDDDSDEEKDVCAICDNGGNLVCCEGRCLRSFHPTKEDGKDSLCESLCLSEHERRGNFECANCRYKRHQCFACGNLGSSDKSAVPEVFHCVSATCGHFYHPDCVSKLLSPEDKSEAEKLQKKIAAGESFTCPAHMCHVCGESENAEVGELNFAICMRCPMSYHRKCLPREIAFENSEDNEDIIVRAWENLLPNNRILIYCLKHKINEKLGTPVRNHVVFPDDERRKKTLDPQSNKKKVLEKRKFVITGSSSHEKIISKTLKSVAKDSDGKHGPEKRQKYFSQQVHDSSEKPKAKDTSKGILRDLKSSMQLDKPGTGDASTVLMGEDKFLHKETELVQSNQQKISTSKSERTIKYGAFSKEERSPLSVVDAETKKEIVSMMEKKRSSVTLDEVLKSHKVPSTHAYSSKNALDKNLTLGKLDASVEAVRTALRKLEDGRSIAEAKAVCGPEIINQIIKWRNKLKVYLAPFLHGMRYTSFGRHFTKVDKLQEIVNKLHWYVKNDDMIVDFACGANDFSWLMKEKLDQVGKRCSFKNYDVIRPKNDFCFEKRDWMTVRPKELPGGSKLIMGLNPPFGVKGGLANMFIDKALEFKPKLLILIVPEETERLDEKKAAYDLIWEDESKLSGKSFYLPGSIDVNDNQMEQWNVKPPRLYLWSRPSWTAEHRAIASEHCHLPTNSEMEVHVGENYNENRVEVEEDVSMDISPEREGPVDISKLIREYGGISGQLSGLPEEHREEKLDENQVAVTPNRFKSSLSEIDTTVNRSRLPGGNPNEMIDVGLAERLHTTSMGKDNGNSSGGAEKSPGNINEADFVPATEVAQGSHGMSSPYGWGDTEPLLDGHLSDISWSPRNPDIFDRGLAGAGLAYGVGFGGQTRIPPDDFGGVGLKYGIPFTSAVDNWSTGTSAAHDDRGIRVSDALSHYSGISDDHRKERNVQLLRLYGQQNELGSSVQRSYLHGQDNGFSSMGSLSSSPYPGLAADSTLVRPNSSAMQRYAPRLDELNHTRLSPFGSGAPFIGQSSIFDNSGLQYPPASSGGIHPDTYGFAPGRRPFPF